MKGPERFGAAAAAMMILLGACAGRGSEPEVRDMSILLTSSDFEGGGRIPPSRTCDGGDTSPPLAWSGVPEGSASLVIICDDPDAPMGTWVHWVVYDIPPDKEGLDAGIPAEGELPDGTKQGRNSWGRIGYGGPCPPSGTHRYFFRIYALDSVTGLPPGATKAEVISAMEGHIIAGGELLGLYSRD